MSDYQLAFTDSLFDQLARLDELYAIAGRRAGRGLRPVLGQLRQTVHGHAADLLQAIDDLDAVAAIAVRVADSHGQLDHLGGLATPSECEYLLSDLLGSSADTETPPVMLAPQPLVGARRFGPGLLSLQLPIAYRESPLAWTLLAGELGQWVAERHGLTDTLAAGRALAPQDHARLARLLADLVALRLVGPAYLAALAARQPHAWLGGPSTPVPSIGQRLAWLLLALEKQGFDLAEAAPMAPEPGPDEPVADALEAAVGLVWELPHLPRFQPDDMSAAADLVSELRDGLPISATRAASKADQAACLARFKAQGDQPALGSAADLLATLHDRPNSAALILNAGWRYRWEVGTSWLQEVQQLAPAEALARYRQLARHLDQLLEKSIETAALHRLLQESP